MDGGARKAAVHGVTKSRTWLSNFTFTFHFHALEKEMATHSIALVWRIPGTAESGGLPSMGSHRVGHDWSDLAAAARVYQFLLDWISTFLFEMLWAYSLENTHCVHSVHRVFWPRAVYHAEPTMLTVTLYSAAILNTICKCSLKSITFVSSLCCLVLVPP